MTDEAVITDMRVRVIGSPWRNIILVELTTSSGVTGLGEATLHNLDDPVVTCLEFIRDRYVIGTDVFASRALYHTITRDLFWRGVLIYTVGSAIEIACTDAAAKIAGVPVYSYLGGPFKTRVDAYANGWYTGDLEPDDVASKGKEVADQGFTALKIDPFGTTEFHCDEPTLKRADVILRELRAAIGPDVEIMLEGHGRFDVASALRVADRLAHHDLAWFEEPIAPEALEAQASVAQRSPIAVAGGERYYTVDEFRRAVELGAFHIAQPDILHVGGFSGMQDIAAVCRTGGVLVAPHNSNSPLCTAASLHSGASFPNLRIQETFDAFDEAAADAVRIDAEFVDGRYELGTGPGLGAWVDEEVAETLERNRGQFNLFAPEWHRRSV